MAPQTFDPFVFDFESFDTSTPDGSRVYTPLTQADALLEWALVSADLSVERNDVARDRGLRTAVIVSLFSDARAEAWDALPVGQVGRRGWFGDAPEASPRVAGDRFGSKLWLLSREKELPSVLPRAEAYATEALSWLIEDGVAAAVTVVASFYRRGVLALDIAIARPHVDPLTFRFGYAWDAEAMRG